jgi:hypothetical protein
MTPPNRKILLNPISSIKRNMFINSKQCPNTTYYSAHVDLNDDDQTQTSMFYSNILFFYIFYKLNRN